MYVKKKLEKKSFDCSSHIIMETTKTVYKEIAIAFANASADKDFDVVKTLLSDKGVFEIQTNNLDTKEVNKKKFLDWFFKKLEETQIESIDYDQCLHCSFGSPVVLFNGGQFPRRIKDSSERSKTGIMLECEDGQIRTLKFCFVFFHTDNDFVFECRIKAAQKRERELGIIDDSSTPF